ncbi:hypothetical protein OSB04_004910 [Centaurea solstitialis]|uniref:AIG1-type G domain-containing protein n=1 Tax=Centaurea solstitialis TaxID=347529 RepID=A0AA38TRM1_9ASTR|nr:hypothetical protein OSB04_004910 [Centaurea solstitialis]
MCDNRFVVFDNKTKDETKKANQVQQLISLVNTVVEKNGGEPYTNEYFTEIKKSTSEQKEQLEEFQVLKQTEGYSEQLMLEMMRVEQLKQIVKMVL